MGVLCQTSPQHSLGKIPWWVRNRRKIKFLWLTPSWRQNAEFCSPGTILCISRMSVSKSLFSNFEAHPTFYPVLLPPESSRAVQRTVTPFCWRLTYFCLCHKIKAFKNPSSPVWWVLGLPVEIRLHTARSTLECSPWLCMTFHSRPPWPLLLNAALTGTSHPNWQNPGSCHLKLF